MQTVSKSPELRPEIVFLYDLVRQLVDGRIRIPRFQRPFVWRREQMIDLLDSISKQYPIGSLLAWETDERIVSLASIGPVILENDSAKTPIYLLDGHQRLSTIAGALVSSKDRRVHEEVPDGQWDIAFNARDISFEHYNPNVLLPSHLFPMSKVLNTFEFLKECERILRQDPAKGELFVERVQDVARRFQNYKIPLILIRETGMTEAVEIFTRLNSKGQEMTADQMVSAILYREGDANPFDLADEIDECMEMLESLGFGGVDRSIILKAVMAAIGEDIYRTDWTRMAHGRREALLLRIQQVMPQVADALHSAIKFLKTEVGVTTDRLIPYAMQLIVIFALFYSERTPSLAQRRLLVRWFWVTSFSGWFGGANPSRVNALVRDVMDRVAYEREVPKFAKFDLSEPAVALPPSFDMRSARARTLLLVLLSLRPRNRYGDVIDGAGDLISIAGPEAVGRILPPSYDRKLGRGPANRMLRDDPSDRTPTIQWLLDCPENIRDVVLESHAIPPRAMTLLQAGNPSGFLAARLERLIDLEHDFMTSQGVAVGRQPIAEWGSLAE